MAEILNYIILPVLTTIITGVVGYIGVKIKGILEKMAIDKTKRDAAETCVRAVEQLYKQLHGEEKYNKCVSELTEMLSEKGIIITELEIKMLIEAAVQKLNESVLPVLTSGYKNDNIKADPGGE